MKDKERISELINSIFDLFDANHNLGNNFLTGELNLSTFEEKSILLGVLLNKKDNFNLEKKLIDLQYSLGVKENSYYNMLLDIFKEMHRDQIITENQLNFFFEKLENYLDTIRNIHLSEYTLIFPINLKFKAGIPIKFLQKTSDIEIKLYPFSIFNNYIDAIRRYITSEYEGNRDTLPDYAQKELDLINKCNHRDNHFFIAKVHARNVSFAVRKVVDSVDINVGLYDLVFYFNMVTLRIGGIFEKSISDIKMPIVYVFNEGEVEIIMFSSYEIVRSAKSIDFRKLNNIIRLMSAIEQFKSENLKKLVYKALDRFFSAITTSKYSVSFLIFWTIIEQLLLKKGGTKLTEIINRLKSIYPDDNVNKRDITEKIDKLYFKRNLFVHESIDKITRDDRNFAKSLVEDLIMFAINLGNEFNDVSQLDFFYQNLRKPHNIIQKDLEALQLLEEIKSRDSESEDS